ncbi:MAG TPA: NUDIX domain-containing protein [Solirubrobacterales bacterium]|nr:NUDIX domain-containing protein [Solirubrobacterales bacterium]
MAAESAGILLYRETGDGVEVLLAHPGGPYWARKDLGAWTIPKGGCDEGEGLRDCALREMGEELGEAPAIAEDSMLELGSVRQKSGKVVHCWAAEGEFDPAALSSNTFSMEWPPRSGSEQEFPEIDRAEWFSPDRAREKILAAQAAFLDRLLERLGAGG